MTKKERDEKKHVPFFTAATFRQSPSARKLEHADACNLIFVDIDELPDGKCPAAPFFNDPDNLFSALTDFNFAAYTTASSTPEKPRMRIVVDADNISLTQYAKAVDTIAGMLGIRSNPESRNAVMPMFLPTLFLDSTEADHPLIAWRCDARTFLTSDIRESNASDQPENRTRKENNLLFSLEFLRTPVPDLTLAIAKEALSHVDADCSYKEWMDIAFALKHQFGNTCSEEAYQLFDEWSSEGTKYGGSEDTRLKWRSTSPNPNNRLPVTIRSLLHFAVEGGWDDTTVRKNYFNKCLDWMERDAASIMDLMEKGPRKILAIPLLSSVQENILLERLTHFAKKRFSTTISITAIRKDVNRLKTEIANQQKAKEKKTEPLWARNVFYVSSRQVFYRHHTGEQYKQEALNASYSRHLLPTEESLRDMGIPISAKTLSKPITEPADYALNHLQIPTVYDVAYDPSQPNERYFVNRGRKYVNTYSPTYPMPDTRRTNQAKTLFETHLATLISEPEYRTILTDFMAFIVQFPGQKIRWCPMIQSSEGAGKSFLADAMRHVLGNEHVHIIDGEAIKKGWNEWSVGYQMVVLEEVRVAGINRFEIMNTLKPLITNDAISVNERHQNNRKGENITNYMAFSNHHNALALTENDRRYFVIKSPLQSKEQVLALGENYFPALYAFLKQHPGALRAYLEEWQISGNFRPDGHAPRTKYVQELIHDSANELTASVRQLLLEGDHPLLQYDIVSAGVLTKVLELTERANRFSNQQLAQVLREEGYKQIGRHLIGEERHYLWIRNGVNETTAPDVSRRRVKQQMKNLRMEMVY